jgi:predicted transcriptional regulator of viral defense system
MTRTISASVAGVLEHLELERPTLVTMEDLARLLEANNVRTPARIVAKRLREKGWLLPTGQRGVWEFASAEVAGAYSSHNPLMGFQSYLIKHPAKSCGLTFQAAAWVYGYADRVPVRPEVAAREASALRTLPSTLASSVFSPLLNYESIKDVPVLARESVIVHMCEKPSAVRSWESALEWMVELAADLSPDKLMKELMTRPQTVKSRTGYLLKGLRTDIADLIYMEYKPKNKTWFGPRSKLLRHDNNWLVADTLLPFDPGSHFSKCVEKT